MKLTEYFRPFTHYRVFGWLEIVIIISVLFTPYMAMAYLAYTIGHLRGKMRPFKFTFNPETRIAGNLGVVYFVMATVFLLTGVIPWIAMIFCALCLWYFERKIDIMIDDLEEREYLDV